jgi:rare lipoprotein A
MRSAATINSGRDFPRLIWALCAALLLVLSNAPASKARGVDHRHAHAHGRLRGHLDHSGRSQTGVASFYGTHGATKPTASGAAMDPTKMTAASRTLPLGTTARVSNRDSGKSAVVKITDRGPFAKHRIIDVSPKAANRLGMKSDGTASVKVTPLYVPR